MKMLCLRFKNDRCYWKTGGIVYFPKGRYYFNRNRANRNFLRINTSHIHIQGEVDEQGTPVSVLVNCNSTLYGKRILGCRLSLLLLVKIFRLVIFLGIAIFKKEKYCNQKLVNV